jgi:NarL family two-component system response regulator LiaR
MPDKGPIRILIADDHAVVREGLRALIETEPGMELVDEAADGAEAVSMARSLQPDVILLDLVMPRKNGIEAIGDIRQENHDARILVLTSFAEDEKVFSAIKAGALGYLLKDASPQELLEAIYNVYRGDLSMHPSIGAAHEERGRSAKACGARVAEPRDCRHVGHQRTYGAHPRQQHPG